MMEETEPVVGRLVDVQGNTFVSELSDSSIEAPSTITIGGEDITLGRVGSYLLVTQGDIRILAMVTRMTEQEKLPPISGVRVVEGDLAIPSAQRTVHLVPLGSLSQEGVFERGVPKYPSTGAEVRALSSKILEGIFAKYNAKKYDIGHHPSNPDLRVFLDPTNLFARHLAILGQTGSGKSCTVATLLQKAVSLMPKAHIILLDLHGEYRWLNDDGNEELAFDPAVAHRIDAVDLEIPYWLQTFAELCDLFIDVGEHTAHNQVAFFRDVILKLKQAEMEPLGLERVTVDTPVYFSLETLIGEIKRINELMVPGKREPKQGPMFGDFDRFLIRLDSRINDVRYDFLLKPETRRTSDSLEPLLRDFIGLGDPKKQLTIIDLSSVPFDVRPTVTAQIGRLVFEFNYWNAQYRDFPILLVCEEAHEYIPRTQLTQYSGARKSMERIAKEGRKYGVGLAVVSQRPHEVSETVLAQCGSYICLRLTNPEDQSYIRNILPEAERDITSILAGLGRGEALALGEGVALPTRIQFDMPNPEPRSQDVDFYIKWIEGPDDLDVKQIVENWRKQNRN